jgi:hypothetical protein
MEKQIVIEKITYDEYGNIERIHWKEIWTYRYLGDPLKLKAPLHPAVFNIETV